MKFEEVLPAFREGRRIKIANVDEGMYQKDVSMSCELTLSRILSNNWEIVKEKVKRTVWINLYTNESSTLYPGNTMYNSEEEAIKVGSGTWGYFGTHSITVEVDE
jgi:hypothetical protein